VSAELRMGNLIKINIFPMQTINSFKSYFPALQTDDPWKDLHNCNWVFSVWLILLRLFPSDNLQKGVQLEQLIVQSKLPEIFLNSLLEISVESQLLDHSGSSYYLSPSIIFY